MSVFSSRQLALLLHRPFIDQSERLSKLLDDPRLEGAIASLCGGEFNYTGGDGNWYSGDTGCAPPTRQRRRPCLPEMPTSIRLPIAGHSDGHSMDKATVRYVKAAFYLDELTKETGCIRVIPGSHHHSDAFASSLQEGSALAAVGDGADVPCAAIETSPGDLVLFNHLIKQ